MRNISFSATTEKIRAHKKHVTRRYSTRPKSIWKNLKPNQHLMGIEKGQGLKKGEKVTYLEEIIVLQVNQEPLSDIIRNPFRKIPINIDREYTGSVYVPETTLEGFPQWSITPGNFVKLFCEMNKCEPETEITRILFDYV